MNGFPLPYVEPVYRPPSEARSLIVQVTNGCSWNRCTYCEMYKEPQKRFAVKRRREVLREIEEAARAWPTATRVFLADGDAMVLSAGRLMQILEALSRHLPRLQRVSAYCLPRNLRRRSAADLAALREAGLTLLYVGAESGDDVVLERVAKGETHASTAAALVKAASAGMATSVMLLNGLGGQERWREHALASAALANETEPDYLATLVLSFPRGEGRFREGLAPGLKLLDRDGLFLELETLLDHTRLASTVFRSDHASNHLALKGVLDRDREAMVETLRLAREHPERVPLRAAWQRGL